MHNPHVAVDPEDRWTIDYADRVVNSPTRSKYGQPTKLRSWIDHILVSPELAEAIEPVSARIEHHDTGGASASTDHHPPVVTISL